MKSLLLALLVLCSANAVMAQNTCDSNLPQILDKDPFPFGKETPFPWRNIEGTWVGYDSKCTKTFFSIRKVQKSESSVPLLRIINFSMSNCEVFYRGLGLEQNRVVTAKMVRAQEPTLDLRIHNFKESALASRNANTTGAKNSVVTMMSLNDVAMPTVQVNLRLKKLSSDPAFYCEVQ